MVAMSSINFSTKRVNQELIDEVISAMKSVRGYGSVEIIIQNYKVTQVSTRDIKKTDYLINSTVNISA